MGRYDDLFLMILPEMTFGKMTSEGFFDEGFYDDLCLSSGNLNHYGGDDHSDDDNSSCNEWSGPCPPIPSPTLILGSLSDQRCYSEMCFLRDRPATDDLGALSPCYIFMTDDTRDPPPTTRNMLINDGFLVMFSKNVIYWPKSVTVSKISSSIKSGLTRPNWVTFL